MDVLNIISLNVKGLNTPEKRRVLLHDMRRLRVDGVLLQETHFRENNLPLLKNRYFPSVYHSQYTEAKSREVSILISAKVPWTLIDAQTDKEGRFLFLKGKIGDRQVTLANLYAPNDHQDMFLKKWLDHLMSYSAGQLIVGSDLNIPLTPSEDTSAGKSSTSRDVLRRIGSFLHSAQLTPGGCSTRESETIPFTLSRINPTRALTIS